MEVIVDAFMLVGLGHLLVEPQQQCVSITGASTDCPETGGLLAEIQLTGTLVSMVVILLLLWTIVRPRIRTGLHTARLRRLSNVGLATVAVGVVVGGLFGIVAAVIASSVVAVAAAELYPGGDDGQGSRW